ncbi:ribonuclease P protein component [Aurantibacter sp.]|uniref:ribonuclease P protein component n=1 Tax=Aurantibacter sp. TaxID=2807103 RepID=UPI0035C7E583
MKLTYNKHEKLKSKKAIEQLFSEGKSISAYPLRLVYLENSKTLKVGVSVSKRNFKKAVHRIRVKRLLREAYRLNKQQLIEKEINTYSIMLLYMHKEMPNFETLDALTKKVFKKFITQLEQ